MGDLYMYMCLSACLSVLHLDLNTCMWLVVSHNRYLTVTGTCKRQPLLL